MTKPNWTMLTTDERKEICTTLIESGKNDAEIVEHFDNTNAMRVNSFIRSHSLRLKDEDRRQGLARLTALRKAAQAQRVNQTVDRMNAKPQRLIGGRDPNTKPNPEGVHFELTNRNTCRWPKWDDDTPSHERFCCGAETEAGTVYCSTHNRQSRGSRINDKAAVRDVPGGNQSSAPAR